MPAYTTPDSIKYPVNTDPVAPLATVITDVATTTQAAITDARADLIAEITANLVPPGTIVATARNTAPSGWVLCQGQSVSRTSGTYLALFEAIGTNYGSASASTFNIPNLKGRVPVGIDPADATFNDHNKTGGAKTVALSVNNLPPHNHLFGADDQVGSQGSYTKISGFNYDATSTTSGAGANLLTKGLYSGSTSSSGNTPHENMPPYNTVHYMIKL
jgi:microcystin-dependent protein